MCALPSLQRQASTPPAQNSTIILQLEGLRDAAGRMARALLLMYLLGVLPLSILLTGYLQILGLAG